MSNVVKLPRSGTRCDAPQHMDATASDEPTHDGGDDNPPAYTIHIINEVRFEEPEPAENVKLWPWWLLGALIGLSL